MNDVYKYLIGTLAGILLCIFCFGGYFLLKEKPATYTKDTKLSKSKEQVPEQPDSTDNIPPSFLQTLGDLTPEQQARISAAQSANEGLSKNGTHTAKNKVGNNTDSDILTGHKTSNTTDSSIASSVAKLMNEENKKITKSRNSTRDLIIKGIDAAQKNKFKEALTLFNKADQQMPSIDSIFAGASYQDMADSLLTLSQADPDTDDAQTARDKAEYYIKKSLNSNNTADARSLYAGIIEAQKAAESRLKQKEKIAEQLAYRQAQADARLEKQKKVIRDLIANGKNEVQKGNLHNAAAAFESAAMNMPADSRFAANSYLDMADSMFKLSQMPLHTQTTQAARTIAENYAKRSLDARNTDTGRSLYAQIIQAQKKAEQEALLAEQKKAATQLQQPEKHKQVVQAAQDAKKTHTATTPKQVQSEKEQRAAAKQTKKTGSTASEAEKKDTQQDVREWIRVGNRLARQHKLDEALSAFKNAHENMPHDDVFSASAYRSMADSLYALSRTSRNKDNAHSALEKADEYIQKSLSAKNSSLSRSLAEKITALKKQHAAQRNREEALAKHSNEQKKPAKTADTVNTLQQKKKIAAFIKKGTIAVKQKNFLEARNNFDKAASLMPDNDTTFTAKAYRDMAESMNVLSKSIPKHKTESLNKGESYIEKSIAAGKKNAAAHYIYSEIAEGLNKSDIALRELETAQQLQPDNALYCVELGRKYFSMRKYKNARVLFENAGKINPKNEIAFFNLGITHKIMNTQTAALDAFEKATDINPNHSRAWCEIARLYDKNKDYPNAIKNYKKTINLDNKNISAVKEMAQVYAKMKNLKDAERYFTQALAMGDNDLVTYYNLAAVQLESGNFHAALKNAEKSVNNKKSNARFLFTYALALEKNKQFQKAEEIYLQAIKADPSYSTPRINLGKRYLDTKKLANAEQHLQAAYKADPTNFDVNINLGKLYGLKKQYSTAITYYNGAIKLQPKNIEAHQNLATVYISANLKENACSTYKTILKVDSQSWDSYYELGKLYISLNKRADAKEILEILLKKNPRYKHVNAVKKLLAPL